MKLKFISFQLLLLLSLSFYITMSTSNLGHLPAEIISSILQHISDQDDLFSCSVVNRCFYKQTLPFLWRRFTEGIHFDVEEGGQEEERMAPQSVDSLMQQQLPHPMVKYVQEVELCSRWTETQLMQLMSRIGPQLEKVTMFSGRLVSDTCLQALAYYWPRLTQLELHYHNVTPDFMMAIAQHCPQLRDLYFFGCPRLSPNIFAPLVETGIRDGHAPPLEKLKIRPWDDNIPWTYQTVLDLSQFAHLTSFSINALAEFMYDLITTIAVMEAWPHLTHLELTCVNTTARDDDEDDDLLIPFIQTHRQLRHVYLQGFKLTNATLEAMATYLPDLTYLGLRFISLVTVRGVRRLVRDAWCLERMDLPYCSIYYYEFPEAVYIPDDDNDNENVSHLDQEGMDQIRRIGPQGICDDDNDDDDDADDDEDKAWLRQWQRSFVNLRLYGSGVA
ncbi:hypothetical protein BCR42DRAFT_456933 [Absidia repens]|uniref:F-box domain-containing protein n=1 Tax=Absidia repens TaxID=90262 RepID=A0A1X2HZS0_9FUNG|nr:hypothetical protein BCR42DRAFT_456933 [Absidia repens]